MMKAKLSRMRTLKYVVAGLYISAMITANILSPSSLADTPEPATHFNVPDHAVPILQHAQLPEPVLAVEVLRALEYWNPRILEGTLLPWANAIADAAGSREDAIWLASQASVETKFIPEVLSFRCNRGGYLMCDHGNAVGPWQMHMRKMLDATPATQAETAINWMRRNPRAWTTWKAARVQADQWLHSQ